MVSVLDISELSVETADDELPCELLELEDLRTAISIESLSLTHQNIPNSQFYVGLSTEEEGLVMPIVNPENENKLVFPLKDFNLCVNLETKEPLFYIYSEEQVSIVAQVQFKVGGADHNEQLKMVDADVFQFGRDAQAVTVKIGDARIFRLAIEMRYVYKDISLPDFDIVPSYTSAESLIDFDTKKDGSMTLVLCGRAFYPNHDVMVKHNIQEFGRGNLGEYFPKMSVELCAELTAKDLCQFQMLHALLCFLHPPYAFIQHQFVRPLLIFAYVNRMPFLLKHLEDAIIMEPPVKAKLLLDHFQLGEKWSLANLIRASLLRVEQNYNDIARQMVRLPSYASTLSLELRQTIEDRLLRGWSLQTRRLGDRTPTKNLNRIVFVDHGGLVQGDGNDNDLHTFAEVHSWHAFKDQH